MWRKMPLVRGIGATKNTLKCHELNESCMGHLHNTNWDKTWRKMPLVRGNSPTNSSLKYHELNESCMKNLHFTNSIRQLNNTNSVSYLLHTTNSTKLHTIHELCTASTCHRLGEFSLTYHEFNKLYTSHELNESSTQHEPNESTQYHELIEASMGRRHITNSMHHPNLTNSTSHLHITNPVHQLNIRSSMRHLNLTNPMRSTHHKLNADPFLPSRQTVVHPHCHSVRWIYVYMYIYLHTYIHRYIQTSACQQLRIRTVTVFGGYMYVYIYIHTYINTHIQICTYIRTATVTVGVCKWWRVRNTHTYTHTHTHTNILHGHTVAADIRNVLGTENAVVVAVAEEVAEYPSPNCGPCRPCKPRARSPGAVDMAGTAAGCTGNLRLGVCSDSAKPFAISSCVKIPITCSAFCLLRGEVE